MIEAHIQISPDEEQCDHCIGTEKPAEIEPFTEFWIVYLDEQTAYNLCIEHFIAMLQLKLSRSSDG